ncbi:MAG: hypothetical protein KDE03_17825 [Rhodobacteraceae bacterium]|nr:hypothetical protein [Paracoccaceae bacterium]
MLSLSTPKETKGVIGERYDDTSGLQYLNARYYDPRLGMFVQPDWWEVTWAGEGTNRYSYSFNDPINGKDPSGHQAFGYSRDDFYRDLLVTSEIQFWGAADEVAPYGAIAADVALDFTPGIGDVKGVYEAEGPLETTIAIVGALTGPIGDATRRGTKTLKAMGIIGPASRRVYQEFKTFKEFKEALGAAGEGRVWHHIVEQCQGKCTRAQFSGEMINNTDNIVNIPREVNQRLADIYAGKQPYTQGKTLRDWLNDKPYEEQYRRGKELLEEEMERYEKDPENYR